MNTDYKLANIRRQELKRQEQRREILASESGKALDMILEAPSPATLVQSFPDQDLYALMHKVGVHDFIPVLAMATSRQWEYIMDVEIWDDDRMDLHLMTQVFAMLYKADKERLLRWSIMEKPAFIEYFLFHNIQVVIREHDEPPPEDFDDYTTLDDKFYFRFPDKKTDPLSEESGDELLPGDTPRETERHEEAPELIETMLKKLAEMDLSVFHGLMLETCALLPAEAEEEEFRLRNIRLAEKGFLPAHEAVGIYQPVRTPRKRPARLPQITDDPDQPLPPQFFAQFIEGDLRFVQAIKHLAKHAETGRLRSEIFELHNELAALVNKIISADRIKIRKTRDIRGVMEKANAYLNLGLEVMLGNETGLEQAAGIVDTYFLEDLFREGSRQGIALKTQAAAWYGKSYLKGNNLPLSFLGETYLGVVGGLLIERPMFFANYADGELYRNFNSLTDIRSTRRILDEIQALDAFLHILDPDIATFTKGVLTYKSMILTLWAKTRIWEDRAAVTAAGLDPDQATDLSPIPRALFSPFFKDLFSGGTGTIAEDKARDLGLWAADRLGVEQLDAPLQRALFSLIHELEDEYGHVPPGQLDPRFMPLFLISGEAGEETGDED